MTTHQQYSIKDCGGPQFVEPVETQRIQRGRFGFSIDLFVFDVVRRSHRRESDPGCELCGSIFLF